MEREAGRFGWVGALVFTGAMLASGTVLSGTALAQRTYTFPAYQVQAMCMGGNPDACYEQGLHQYWGDEMPSDRYAAYRSWQQACAGNHQQSCWEVAYGYQEGTYLPPNPQLGFQMFVQNCSRGHASSCNSVGYAYENAQGAPLDIASAYRYYEMGCNLGDTWGCRNQGIYLRDGRPGVVAPDPMRGIQLISLACTRGLAQACTEAAQAPAPTMIPIPQQCGMSVASYGPLQIGSPVTLGYHTPWAGDANWATEMGRFVGMRTTVMSFEGLDTAGCPVIRVQADGGQYFWRIRNMSP